MTSQFPHNNNLDLVRLFAAAQVVILHGIEHLGLRLPFHAISLQILEAFPGVPIFFIISGFLISASYQRSPSISDFFKNRVLRLFPALWLCFGVSLCILALSGYSIIENASAAEFALWTATQLSFIQFYNPEFLRGFGVGAINGSLWTIPVEMQFYILTPLLMFAFSRYRKLFWVTLAFFVIINFLHTRYLLDFSNSSIIVKFLSVTFLPWFYMFMVGALCNLYWDRIRPFVEGRFFLWLFLYSLVILASFSFDIGTHSNSILFPWVLGISGLVLSAAFTRPSLADILLQRNDISYGIYIYHMPIFNYVIETQFAPQSGLRWIAVLLVFAFAYFSWRFVERPALALKNSTLFKRSRSERLQ